MAQYYQQYYQQVKQELTNLVYWIRNGERTLKDAAEKLREAREKLKEPIDIQREKLKAELEERRNELINLISNYTGLEDRKAIERLAEEKSQGFPWLSQAYADYFYLQDLKLADYLETKPHTALETANEIRGKIASKRRIAEQLYRVLKYKLEYYERLFPWLVDFGEEGIDDLIRQTVDNMQKGVKDVQEPEDAVVVYTSDGERTAVSKGKLSRQELFQRALDRHRQNQRQNGKLGETMNVISATPMNPKIGLLTITV